MRKLTASEQQRIEQAVAFWWNSLEPEQRQQLGPTWLKTLERELRAKLRRVYQETPK